MEMHLIWHSPILCVRRKRILMTKQWVTHGFIRIARELDLRTLLLEFCINCVLTHLLRKKISFLFPVTVFLI